MLLLHLLEVEYLGLLEDLERVKLAIVLVLAQPHAAERARPQRRVLIQVVELQLGVLHHRSDRWFKSPTVPISLVTGS